MRTALISLALLASACSSPDMCRSLAVGASIGGLPRTEVTERSDFVIRAMRSPSWRPGYGEGTSLVFHRGPADEAMCCSTQQAGQALEWCTPELLTCGDASMSGLELYTLGKPYSDQSRVPDDATYCFVALQGDRIVAIWHRYWS